MSSQQGQCLAEAMLSIKALFSKPPRANHSVLWPCSACCAKRCQKHHVPIACSTFATRCAWRTFDHAMSRCSPARRGKAYVVGCPTAAAHAFPADRPPYQPAHSNEQATRRK